MNPRGHWYLGQIHNTTTTLYRPHGLLQEDFDYYHVIYGPFNNEQQAYGADLTAFPTVDDQKGRPAPGELSEEE